MTPSQKQRGERQALLSLAIMMEWPIRIAGVLSSLLIFVSFCLMIFAIFQRYFLNTPLKWGDEMLGYLLVAIVMSGMAEALRRGDHVAIDLLTSFFGIKIRALLTYLSYTAVLAFAVIFGMTSCLIGMTSCLIQKGSIASSQPMMNHLSSKIFLNY